MSDVSIATSDPHVETSPAILMAAFNGISTHSLNQVVGQMSKSQASYTESLTENTFMSNCSVLYLDLLDKTSTNPVFKGFWTR